MREVEIRQLQPLTGSAHQRPRPRLRALSDDELLQAARSPKNADWITVNTVTGSVVDGNGRAHELIRRAADPASSIRPDMTVPVQEYTPDVSMFPDLD